MPRHTWLTRLYIILFQYSEYFSIEGQEQSNSITEDSINAPYEQPKLCSRVKEYG